MLVVGFVLLLGFGIFEWLVAPVPMINFTFLSDRTVVGACLLDATYQVAYYCWANYFSSFLQVVNNLSISEAGYVGNASDVVSNLLLFLVGYSIRRTNHFKWLLYLAVPLYILAQGLMIYFRRPDQSVGYLVFTQVLISVGGSIFVIVFQVADLAAVDHQHVAAALSLLYVVGTVGDALGATISGGIWTNTFRGALVRKLPPSARGDLQAIYEGLDKQLSYAVGTKVRLAIQEAYGYAQTRMLAAGTEFMGLGIVWTLMMRDINVGEVAQVRGTVF
ncbi:uncharacterized protein LTR77_000092 [Saxophila tyrrhenica]|uniref:Uncharacterized protein n=1 Tax=Saxophila tyrrhenica TaxID=1690608 RepID=A0AAV9PLT4_9PEZI|nr:hypothetical protein LTR77_000092 [Saxophila tyrrhenica]